MVSLCERSGVCPNDCHQNGDNGGLFLPDQVPYLSKYKTILQAEHSSLPEIERVAPVSRDLRMIQEICQNEISVDERQIHELLDMQLLTLVQEHVMQMPVSRLHGVAISGDNPKLMFSGKDMLTICKNAAESLKKSDRIVLAELEGMEEIYCQFVNGLAADCVYFSPAREGCDYGICIHLQKDKLRHGQITQEIYLYGDEYGNLERSRQMVCSVTGKSCSSNTLEEFIANPHFSSDDLSQSIQHTLGLDMVEIERCERMSHALFQQSATLRKRYSDAVLRMAAITHDPRYQNEMPALEAQAREARDAMMGLGALIKGRFDEYERASQVQKGLHGLDGTIMINSHGDMIFNEALSRQQVMALAHNGRAYGLPHGSSCAFGAGVSSSSVMRGFDMGFGPLGAIFYAVGLGGGQKETSKRPVRWTPAMRRKLEAMKGGEAKKVCCPFCCCDGGGNPTAKRVTAYIHDGEIMCSACGACAPYRCK